jgi:hypothetical protein
LKWYLRDGKEYCIEVAALGLFEEKRDEDGGEKRLQCVYIEL